MPNGSTGMWVSCRISPTVRMPRLVTVGVPGHDGCPRPTGDDGWPRWVSRTNGYGCPFVGWLSRIRMGVPSSRSLVTMGVPLRLEQNGCPNGDALRLEQDGCPERGRRMGVPKRAAIDVWVSQTGMAVPVSHGCPLVAGPLAAAVPNGYGCPVVIWLSQSTVVRWPSRTGMRLVAMGVPATMDCRDGCPFAAITMGVLCLEAMRGASYFRLEERVRAGAPEPFEVSASLPLRDWWGSISRCG